MYSCSPGKAKSDGCLLLKLISDVSSDGLRAGNYKKCSGDSFGRQLFVRLRCFSFLVYFILIFFFGRRAIDRQIAVAGGGLPNLLLNAMMRIELQNLRFV